jgi:hypothetical protein
LYPCLGLQVERGRIAPQDAEKYSNTLLMQMFQDNQEDFHASFGHTGANAGAGEAEGTENDAAASAAAAGGSTFYFDEQDAVQALPPDAQKLVDTVAVLDAFYT